MLYREIAPKMWKKLHDFRGEKKAQNPVTSLSGCHDFFLVPIIGHIEGFCLHQQCFVNENSSAM